MKAGFEESLRNSMEDASLNELMPEFDSEQEWNRLSSKLRPEKKRILMPVWAYAAGILLLTLAGWFWANHNSREQTLVKNIPAQVPVQPQINASEQTKQAPTPITNSVSAPIAKQPIAAVNTPKIKQQNQPKIKTIPPVAKDTISLLAQYNNVAVKPATKQDTTTAINVLPEQKTTITIVKKSRPRAVNVLDIENEDRQFMINEAPVGTFSNPFLAKLHSVLTQDAFAGSDRYYPLQGIFKK